EPPQLLVFVEHLAHLRDRLEYKALHEWIDVTGGQVGLDQETIRAICRQERQRSANIGSENSTAHPAVTGEINSDNGVPVAKTTMLDKRAIEPLGIVEGRQHIRGNIPIRNPDFTGRGDLLNA